MADNTETVEAPAISAAQQAENDYAAANGNPEAELAYAEANHDNETAVEYVENQDYSERRGSLPREVDTPIRTLPPTPTATPAEGTAPSAGGLDAAISGAVAGNTTGLPVNPDTHIMQPTVQPPAEVGGLTPTFDPSVPPTGTQQ